MGKTTCDFGLTEAARNLTEKLDVKINESMMRRMMSETGNKSGETLT